MSLPAAAISERAGSRTDKPVLVAALGSSLIAVPGAWGLLILAAMVVGAPWDQELGRIALRFLIGVVLLGLPLLGFYLLVGYWRAFRRGTPSPRPRRFWWLSATYNGLGFGLALLAAGVEAWDGNMGVPLVLSVPHTAWTGFMVWLGVTRGRRAPATGAPGV